MEVSDRLFALVLALAIVAATCAVLLVVVPAVPDAARSLPAGNAIALVAGAFGLLGAVSGSAQLRQMLATGAARDVSRSFLAMLSGSFLAWLAYGVVLHDTVMLVVNTAGVAVTVTTLACAVRLQRRVR